MKFHIEKVAPKKKKIITKFKDKSFPYKPEIQQWEAADELQSC